MKVMKTSIGLALSLLLLFFCVLFPVSAAEHPFTDVPEGSWYNEYVQYVYDNGLMNGTSTTTFSPETEMDRAMLVTVLYRMDGSKKATCATPFTDVDTDGYYYDALLWAYESKIINGTSTTQFSPHISISREMMVTIFYRYAQYIGRDVSKEDSLNAYTDAGSISGYAKTPFMWSVANGIISGVSSDTLSPLGTATRAQCAAVLKRFVEWTQTGNGTEEHTHSYTAEVTAEATCTTEGTRVYTCTCGKKYAEPIPATGHDYTETVTKPTCTEKGYTTYKCKKCSHSYKGNETNATGHAWGEWVTTKEPTETSTGTAERKCANCGEVETKTLDKLPEEHKHSYTGKVTTAATCTKDGVKTYTCSCGDSYTEVIKATGHKYSVSSSKAATCTEDGYKNYKCSNCGDTYTETVKATGHNYKQTDSKAATCTTDGYTKYTCSKCNHSYSEPIKATGHSYKQTDSKAATCTTDGYKSYKCNNCGHTYKETIEATGHNYQLTDSKAATCTVDGYKKYTCSKCGHSYTETVKGEHDWQHEHTDEVGHYEYWYVCHCGGWEFNAANGSPVDSFADHAQSTGEAQNHSYYDERRWVVDTPAKDLWRCKNCGATSNTKPQGIECLPVEILSVSECNGKKCAK